MFGILTITLFTTSLSLCLAAPQARIGNSTIVGARAAANTEFFGGIPFAEPPVGKLRFSPPVLSTSIPGPIFNATSFGAPCMQVVQGSPGASQGSEDCLTLNVFRPAGISSNAQLPVMAWLYGGGFITGASSQYNATLLVARSVTRGTPIIYVSMNYRVGPLGFPTGLEAQKRGALNLGLKDQLAALRWIQTNIRHFGGDGSKITLFGESAGAMSIADLYLNSKLENLVRGAIMQSGSQGSVPVPTPPDGAELWQSFVNAVPSCAKAKTSSGDSNNLDCLRNVPATDLIKADSQVTGGGFVWMPVIDGPAGLIPDLPSRLIASGRFSKVPFIAGTNLDEGTFFAANTINSVQKLKDSFKAPGLASLSALSKDPIKQEKIIDELVSLYPDTLAAGSPFGTGNETFVNGTEWKRAAAIVGDIQFQGPRRAWIQAAAAKGMKTFGYLFTDPQPLAFAPGVAHGSDVAYVYGQDLIGLKQSPGFSKLSQRMIDYWVSFAVSLDPNDHLGSTRDQWPEYMVSKRDFAGSLLVLNSENMTVIPDTYRKEQISFINSVAAKFQR